MLRSSRRKDWLIPAMLPLLAIGCGSDNKADLAALISAANRSFESAFQAQNAGAVAALYTSIGQLLPPGAQPVTGTANIQAFWQAVMGMGIRSVRLTTNELLDCGESAVEVGAYELLGATNNTLDRGKYVVIWRSENGQWKLHRDIWNTSVPVA